jgi:predicted amidohydrolase
MSDSAAITISLAQMDIRPGKPDQNLANAQSFIAQAASRGSDLVVLPELWDTGYALDRAQELGTTAQEGRFAAVAELARAHQIHIVGSLLELGHPRGTSRPAYNTAIWFGPDGSALGSYRKIHLFRHQPLFEDQHILPGGVPHWVQSPWGPAAMAICYDLRFPELFRTYAAACGALLTIIPAQWPQRHTTTGASCPRSRHRKPDDCGCNRVGESEGQVYGGSSVIYDAWGNPVIEAGPDEDLLTARIDISEVAAVRSKLPVLEDRRPDLYHAEQT